jgi:hypothetical protein
MKIHANSAPRPTHGKKNGLMRPLSVIVIAACMTFSLAAADLAGTWKGSMRTQMGESEVIITIQPGSSLTGKVKLADYEGEIQNGKLAGEKISFETTIEPGKVGFEGTVAADQMQLNVVGTQGDPYKLICVRQN